MQSERTEPTARPLGLDAVAMRPRDYLRCHALWSPAVQLFRNLPFRAKAAIISGLFMVPILFLGGFLTHTMSAQWRANLQERSGLAYATTLLPAIHSAREFRRQTMAASADTPPATLVELDRQLQAQLALVQQGPAGGGPALNIQEAWSRADKARQNLAPASAGLFKVLTTHSQFSEALLELLADVTDGSGLTLNPDPNIHSLTYSALRNLPVLLEASEKMRTLSASMARAGQTSELAVQELSRQDGIIKYFSTTLATDLRKVFPRTPDGKDSIPLDTALAALNALRATATDAPGTEGAQQAQQVEDMGAQSTQMLLALQHQALDRLVDLLTQRQHQLRRDVVATAGLTGLCLALAGYFFYAFSLVMRLGLREVQLHVEAITQADLTTQPQAQGRDEVASLLRGLRGMQLSLQGIVTEVRGGTDHIAIASSQIAASARDLATRTQETAADLEKSALAMESISSTVKDTAEHAHTATDLATQNADAADRGGRVMTEMVQTMEDIRASSRQISDIIGVIDGIAFQTNILALNAAVEAARAGNSGRGFAVVASEVRALAHRSAEAAQAIKKLISSSVERVEAGAVIAHQAGNTITDILNSSKQVSALLGPVRKLTEAIC